MLTVLRFLLVLYIYSLLAYPAFLNIAANNNHNCETYFSAYKYYLDVQNMHNLFADFFVMSVHLYIAHDIISENCTHAQKHLILPKQKGTLVFPIAFALTVYSCIYYTFFLNFLIKYINIKYEQIRIK